MLLELPKEQLLYLAAAFLVGWILSAILSRIGANLRSKQRDPRDDRIRALEAEARIARSEAQKMTEQNETNQKDLARSNEGTEKRDNVIAHQQKRIETLTRDLKASVRKTRELRAELSERATENMRSEAKIREVETELEVAQASTDMLATGVLDYSLAPQSEDEHSEEANEPDFGKTAI